MQRVHIVTCEFQHQEVMVTGLMVLINRFTLPEVQQTIGSAILKLFHVENTFCTLVTHYFDKNACYKCTKRVFYMK